ncbi:hypothetical protein [Nonomuraea sp. LPB2021202275-12-8]|uniref:hypothetical protein n=1 Tax=Nonomuraea sp. LPB2021202275-12-8 TaxID=3120159 RepID=UPI00300C74DC
MGPIRDAGAAGILAFNEQRSSCPIPPAISQKPFSGPMPPVGIPGSTASTSRCTPGRTRST